MEEILKKLKNLREKQWEPCKLCIDRFGGMGALSNRDIRGLTFCHFRDFMMFQRKSKCLRTFLRLEALSPGNSRICLPLFRATAFDRS